MKISKKIATLGLIGIMTIGQAMAPLAATGYYISAPSAVFSGRTQGYCIQTRADANTVYSHCSLGVGIQLFYLNPSGTPSYTERKVNWSTSYTHSYSYRPVFTGSDISESKFFQGRSYGYYRAGAAGAIVEYDSAMASY